MPTSQQVAQTAENILCGEKSFRTVQFAVSGCMDADMLSGIHALMRELPCGNRVLQHLFEYCAARARYLADLQDRTQQQYSPAGVAGGLGGTSYPGFGGNPLGGLPMMGTPYATSSGLDQSLQSPLGMANANPFSPGSASAKVSQIMADNFCDPSYKPDPDPATPPKTIAQQIKDAIYKSKP